MLFFFFFYTDRSCERRRVRRHETDHVPRCFSPVSSHARVFVCRAVTRVPGDYASAQRPIGKYGKRVWTRIVFVLIFFLPRNLPVITSTTRRCEQCRFCFLQYRTFSSKLTAVNGPDAPTIQTRPQRQPSNVHIRRQ